MLQSSTAWVAIVKDKNNGLNGDGHEGDNYFTIRVDYIEHRNNSRVQHLPPLSRQADSSPRAVEQLFVPCGIRLPKTPANELKPNLFEFLQRVQQCFNKVKGNCD